MSDITVTYKDSTIATMDASGTKTLKTAGKYCDGDIGIEYEKPVPVWSYLGANPVKVLDIAETETALANTGFATWTPSTTATTIVNLSDVGSLELDMENYEYVILWFFDASIVYDGTETNAAKITRQVQFVRGDAYRAPNNLESLSAKNYDVNRFTGLFISALCRYYSTTGVDSLTYTQAVGIYPTSASSTFSSTLSNTPTLTIKTPNIRALCSTSYFSTSNAGKVDKANSKFKLRGEVWRVDKRGVMGEMYKNIVDMYNGD